MAKKKPITANDWKNGAARMATMTQAMLDRVSPTLVANQRIKAKQPIRFSDVDVPSGTTGTIINAKEWNSGIYYTVRFDGDTMDRLVKDSEIVVAA